MGLGFARVAHLLASHWYYLFMSLHIRMHVGMITNTMRHPAPINCHPEIVLGSHTEEMPEQVRHAKLRKIIPCILLALVCAYGLYAFIARGVWKYLILRQQFFFFDLERGQGLRIIYIYRLFQGNLRVYHKAFVFLKLTDTLPL